MAAHHAAATTPIHTARHFGHTGFVLDFVFAAELCFRRKKKVQGDCNKALVQGESLLLQHRPCFGRRRRKQFMVTTARFLLQKAFLFGVIPTEIIISMLDFVITTEVVFQKEKKGSG